jgi:23S rRNA (cytidine2498-2'-O)-methyltransferase
MTDPTTPAARPARSRPLTPAPAVRGEFLLCGCQAGAEPALRARLLEVHPAFKPGAWRRGVATFRIGPDGFDPPDDFAPELVFARAVVRSLGQVTGDSPAEAAARVRALVSDTAWDAIHVWPRDPRATLPLADVEAAVLAASGVRPASGGPRPGDLVLDIVLDSATRWWVGWHRARSPASTWPGGFYPGMLAADKVSRAWLKLDEALATFEIELEPGARAIELGASPGGACQRLLEAGLEVVGVDAALVDPVVAAHPRFTQWRMRAREVQLKRFARCDWLLADMNIDPRSTMAALGRVLAVGAARPKGVIATLKLPDWSRAAELPEWLAEFRAWGYAPVARQLSTAGREVCVVALPAGRTVRRPSRPATRRRDA